MGIGWFFGDPLDDDRACVQDNIFLGFIKRKNDKATHNTQIHNRQTCVTLPFVFIPLINT